MNRVFFKIGDIVIHNTPLPTAKYAPGDGVEGVVIAMEWGDMPKVRWSDGKVDTYCQGDLELIERKRGSGGKEE